MPILGQFYAFLGWISQSVLVRARSISRGQVSAHLLDLVFRFKCGMEYGIWNSIYLFSSIRYSDFLSTVSFVSCLNPRDGWLSAVQSLHKTLYVLILHSIIQRRSTGTDPFK